MNLRQTIDPVPSNMRPGWRVVNADNIISNPRYLRIEQPRMGVQFEYGKSPNGAYDQVVVTETHGTVTITPVVQLSSGEVLFGGVIQKRPLMNDIASLQAIGGFAEADMSLAESADLELEEEAGIDLDPNSFVSLMPEAGINCNPSFWRTRIDQVGLPDKGIHPFTVLISPDYLERDGTTWTVRRDASRQLKVAQADEQIEQCQFVPFDVEHIAASHSAISLASWLKAFEYWHSRGLVV